MLGAAFRDDDSHPLFDHPAILEAVKEIEKVCDRDEKVLVFGRFTAPLRELPPVGDDAQAANVLPFRAAPKPPEPALSPVEHNAFQELARELSDRLKKTAGKDVPAQMDDDFGSVPAIVPPPEPAKVELPKAEPRKPAGNATAARDTQEARPILDRLPILVWLGAVLLGWIGGAVIATDPAVAPRLHAMLNGDISINVDTTSPLFGFVEHLRLDGEVDELIFAVLGVIVVLVIGTIWRRRKLEEIAAASTEAEAATAPATT